MRNIVILSLAAISILLLPYSYVFGQQGFLLYENPDYNIKIQYPANWTNNEANIPVHSAVYFSTPTQYSFETPNATMNIFVLRQDNNSTLDRIVMSLMPSDQQRIQRDDIRIINSSYVTLPGLRAWQQIYYDYANNKSMKALVVLTVNDGEEYQLIFMTQPGEFNKYLDCRKNDKVISDNEINYP